MQKSTILFTSLFTFEIRRACVEKTIILRMATMCIFSLFMRGCASSPQQRSTSERVADVVVGAGSSALTGTSLGANGGTDYTPKLEVILLGGQSCLTLAPASLTLGIIDANTNRIVALALPVHKNWIVIGDLKLVKGEYWFQLTHHSSRVVFKERRVYSGEGFWRPTLSLSCPAIH